MRIEGTVAPEGQVTLRVACPDPPLLAAALCAREFQRHGIQVDGFGRGCGPGQRLASFRSPPLAELVRVINHESNNLWAEQLLRALAPSHQPEEGIQRILATLQASGIGGGVCLRDGCGLSRYNLASPSFMVSFLVWAKEQPWGAYFVSSLPVAGRTGTLAQRLAGTVAQDRVRAKTGSMQGVRALAGYATSSGGSSIVFALMVNGYCGPPERLDEAVDRCCLALAASRL